MGSRRIVKEQKWKQSERNDYLNRQEVSAVHKLVRVHMRDTVADHRMASLFSLRRQSKHGPDSVCRFGSLRSSKITASSSISRQRLGCTFAP